MNIRIENLSKKFKENAVLSNINLNFESGNIYGLYGRNGSGKSVFLKLLCGFYKPTIGKILYDEYDISETLEFPKDMGVLIENPSFFPDLTGLQNLQMLAKIKNKISDKEILETLKIVNLIDEKDKKYSKYSLGMKQKLGIAQAIMEDQKIIILDEPFNGIEEKTVNKMIAYLLEEKKKDKIIILSTHIFSDLEKMSDKIYYFDDGCVHEKNN